MPTATHLLIHRFVPGTGPAEGTPELDAEMHRWEQLDAELRESGILVGAYALDAPTAVLGTRLPAEETVFAVHAITARSDAEAGQLAARMPHLDYGSVEVRPLMAP